MVVFWSSKVKKELLKLDVSNASGVPALVLKKMASPELATLLTCSSFQICFDKGDMPGQWKCAHAIKCYKRGDKGNQETTAHLSSVYYLKGDASRQENVETS